MIDSQILLQKGTAGVLSEHIEKAKDAQQKREWQRALQLWDQCIQNVKQGNQFYFRAEYANTLVELGRYVEAKKKFEALIIDFPDFVDGYMGMARVATLRRNWEAARSFWDRCILRFDSGNQPLWHANYAQALDELGRSDEAEKIYAGIVEKFPDFAEGYIGLARLAQNRSDWENSCSLWWHCIQHFDNGSNPCWYSNYAQALTELSRFTDAEKVYLQLIKNFPDFCSGHIGLATIAHKQQNWKRAVKLWRHCSCKCDGYNSWWMPHYLHALIETEQFKQALKIAESVKNFESIDSYLPVLLARLYWLTGDLKRCLQYGKLLSNDYPQLSAGYYWCMHSLNKLGRYKDAAKVHMAAPVQSIPVQQDSHPDDYPADLTLPLLCGAGNDYTFIEKLRDAFMQQKDQFTLGVSVVIPVYNQAEMLAKTLAALTHQCYPRGLMEVIVADDGSSDAIGTVIKKYQHYLDLRYVRQEDRGFRLAAVRNLGIQAASHEYIILQDADTIPDTTLLVEYMSYFHVTQNAVLFGLRSFVCADEYDDDAFLHDPNLPKKLPIVATGDFVSDWRTEDGCTHDWRLPVLVETNNLKESIFPSVYAFGCSLAFPLAATKDIGLFDETFNAWGGEDCEFGYRLYNAGYYVIPLTEIGCFHQEPRSGGSTFQVDRKAGSEKSIPILEQKVPISTVRNGLSDRKYQVPKVSVYIIAYNMASVIRAAVESILNQSFSDLEVVVFDNGSTDNTLQVLEKSFKDARQVRWISQEHMGVAASCNRAVRNCRGMYIGQLDGDKILKPTAVEILAAFLDENNTGAVYSHYHWRNREEILIKESFPVLFSRERLLTTKIYTQFGIFRKRDWLRTEGFDESLMHAVEYDMMLKLSEVCAIACVPQETYVSAEREGRCSAVIREKQRESFVTARFKALARMNLSNCIQKNSINQIKWLR